MAKPTFRDRFFTPQVARALWSPLGILAAGAGAAAGIVVGLPIVAAAGVGAAAYAVRVAVAIPKGKDADGIDPFALDDPWRSFVWQAKRAQRQFSEEVKRAKDGPLKERLCEIEERIDTGVEECWQVAQGGHALTQARARVDLASVTTQLSQLPTGPQLEQNPALVATARALQSQLDTARRMDEIIASTQDRLRLLDARLGELVTRVVELSVRPEGFDDLAAIGIDVDSVVGEMEALRLALAETDQAGRTSSPTMPLPAPLASPAPLATASDPPGAPAPGAPGAPTADAGPPRAERAGGDPPQPAGAEPGGHIGPAEPAADLAAAAAVRAGPRRLVSDLTTDPTEPTAPPPAADLTDADAGSGQLARSSGIVAIGTLASRITGLVRTMLLTVILGTAALGNGYGLANTTPNMIYDLLLGGILSATLVPVLVSNRTRKDQRGTDAVLTVATVALVAITAIAFVLAPAIIRLYTVFSSVGDEAPTDADIQLATDLFRLFAPQILFYGLTTLGSALLNAHRRFAAAAFAPVLNNIMLIAVLIVASQMITGAMTAEQALAEPGLVVLLGVGTTAGIAAMAIVLWPAIRRAGIRTRLNFDWRNPSVRKVARLSGWTFGYAIANQITVFVILSLSYGLDGGVTVWNAAYQFFQLPYGVFTVSVMTAFTPELATLDERGERSRFTERFFSGLRLAMVVLVPATVGFILLARPMVQLLLEYKNFGAGDVEVTVPTIIAFGWGIIGFSVYLYTLRAFYAMKDTRTPFLVNVVQNVVTIVLAFVLVTDVVTPGGLGVAGLAWSWSGAYTFAAVLALIVLHRRIGTFGPSSRATTSAIGRMAAAGVVMAAAIAATTAVLDRTDPSPLLLAGAGTIVGLAVYIGLTIVLRVPEIRDLTRVVLRRG